jgi:NADPH2:quinone reductase
MTVHGGFAERAVVDGVRVVRLPDDVPFDTAAGLLMAYGTALHALKQRGQVRPGESVLVLGAAGGVGLAAVELAHAMGARVIAGASSAQKLEVARRHGADVLINYAEEDLREALAREEPVDVIYDPVGGALAERLFAPSRREGGFW